MRHRLWASTFMFNKRQIPFLKKISSKLCVISMLILLFMGLQASRSPLVNHNTTSSLTHCVFTQSLIVQLPLPPHICERKVLSEVCTDKDVDGFHPINIGRVAMKGHNPQFIPGTPKGVIMLLKRSGIEMAGKQAVVIGRSNIVGTPVALLLMHEDATVTVCHSRTPQEEMMRACKNADIVIAAAGRPEMVKADWIKPGATVIDVGTNSVPDATRKTGYRLVGDVAYAEVRQVAGAVTPVPGGVGPMTVAMLLLQTLESAQRHFGVTPHWE
eukprot:TRINITY_DN335_c0_g1_i2.p1 TRINITY_DN335_c0_g1~~TRINITY_DN335_c0_g1_i2.p1  ORF type:complete len:271 (-),score=32.80 TRINITY_DN335_c0_g1_i2:144-956(-)